MADKKKKSEREAKEGFALLLAPDGVSSCSFDGGEYSVDESGAAEVPVAAVPALLEHGFVAL